METQKKNIVFTNQIFFMLNQSKYFKAWVNLLIKQRPNKNGKAKLVQQEIFSSGFPCMSTGLFSIWIIDHFHMCKIVEQCMIDWGNTENCARPEHKLRWSAVKH